MLTIIDYALAVLQLVPKVIAAGMNVANFIGTETAKMQAWNAAGTDPTQADFDALNALQASDEAALQSDDK